MGENTKDVEYLFGSSDTTWKNNNCVAQPHKTLQPLFNVRHDDQVFDNGVGGFRGNDTRFRYAKILTICVTLFAVANGCPFHGPFHGPGAATRTDILVA